MISQSASSKFLQQTGKQTNEAAQRCAHNAATKNTATTYSY